MYFIVVEVKGFLCGVLVYRLFCCFKVCGLMFLGCRMALMILMLQSSSRFEAWNLQRLLLRLEDFSEILHYSRVR